MFWRVLALAACLLALPAVAAPPTDGSANPAWHDWFQHLQQPQSRRPCCAISDCRLVRYGQQGDQYEVWIDGWHYLVPRHVVIDTPNPTGRAVVCYTYATFQRPSAPGETRDGPQDQIEILCFVPEQPISCGEADRYARHSGLGRSVS